MKQLALALFVVLSSLASSAQSAQDYAIDGWTLYPPDAVGSSEQKISDAVDAMAASYPNGALFKGLIDSGQVNIGEMSPGDNPSQLPAHGTHDKDTVALNDVENRTAEEIAGTLGHEMEHVTNAGAAGTDKEPTTEPSAPGPIDQVAVNASNAHAAIQCRQAAFYCDLINPPWRIRPRALSLD